jgi:uncharacterized protein
MTEPLARLSLVTLGVSDLARSTTFYEALGFRRKSRGADGVAFFEAGGVILSLWPVEELVKDAEIESSEQDQFRGMSLAWNCTSAEEVDVVLAKAAAAGGSIVVLVMAGTSAAPPSVYAPPMKAGPPGKN